MDRTNVCKGHKVLLFVIVVLKNWLLFQNCCTFNHVLMFGKLVNSLDLSSFFIPVIQVSALCFTVLTYTHTVITKQNMFKELCFVKYRKVAESFSTFVLIKCHFYLKEVLFCSKSQNFRITTKILQ